MSKHTKTTTPPYIRWYNAHWPLLAALPTDLREIVSTVATLTPRQRQQWKHEANKVMPRIGTLIVRMVQS